MKGFRAVKEEYALEEMNAATAILHVGCAGSPNCIERFEKGILLHKKLCDHAAASGARIAGVDIDDDALNYLREKLPEAELAHVDAHNLAAHFEPESFDLVISGDVLEHLPNPGLHLTSCAEVLRPGGKLIVTAPNAYGIVRFLKALFFHEAVHPEHTAYYSHKTMTRLMAMSGLKPVDCGYYRCEPVWMFPSLARIVGNAIENATCVLWPQFSEGIIVTAQKEK